MAQVFAASIYKIGSQDLKTGANRGQPATQGITIGLPSAGTIIEPLQETVTANGVTMISKISVAPTGLNQPAKTYYSATAVATLITAANA